MRVATVGECMMEFRDAGSGLFALGYGGDTFNTAVYLRRLGLPVAYVTALGDDPFSDEIVDICRNEQIDVDLIARVPGHVPGLYLIRTDERGERVFHYWRDSAPARRLFELEGATGLARRLSDFHLIHLSGITLSLYSPRGRAALFEALDQARIHGCRVSFDGNYRARGWPDGAAARAAFEAMLQRVDIALPTLDDEQALFGDRDAGASIRRYLAAGAHEVVVKDGPRGCTVAERGREGSTLVPVETVVKPMDTTAAGDSFNAGYLAARAAAAPPVEAARAGHHLAAVVIGHRGAIIDRRWMPPPHQLWSGAHEAADGGAGATGEGG